MKDRLIAVMRAAGKPLEALHDAAGAAVLVSPYGGRILGLFAPEGGENFLWTHEALAGEASAKALIGGDAWQNLGGDRTWLAPEVDFFLPHYPDTGTYFQQRALDPGNYKVQSDGGKLRLSTSLELESSRLKESIQVALTKSVTPAPHPLRHERGLEDLAGLAYAGYTLRTEVAIVNQPPRSPQQVGIWNLLQMPHGGELIIPTFSRSEPRIYFGQIPPEELRVDDQLIRYRMVARGEHKLGVRALSSTGRVGYLYPSGEQWALMVRNFLIDPSGEYIDVPWTDDAYRGFSTQACNVNNHLGCFSELEYHAPAIGPGTGSMHGEDTSTVWAFRGPIEPIRRVGRLLLCPQF